MIPLAVIWGGYTLGWYGWAVLHQTSSTGVGFTDLILPSRLCKVLTAMQAWGIFDSGSSSSSGGSGNSGLNSGSGAPSYTPGTAPGTASPPGTTAGGAGSWGVR